MTTIRFRAVAICLTVLTVPTGVFAQTDWDLYALRLLNLARATPAPGAAIIGATVVANRPPRAPLDLYRVA